MRVMRFGARVAAGPRGGGVIAVPFDPDETWGAKAEHHVNGTVNGRRVRATIAPGDGGWAFLLGLSRMRDMGLAVGSTMLEGDEPDGELWAPRLLKRGQEFVPSIAQAQVKGVMACPRPRSFDNRPILGRIPGQNRLWIASGHGGRGMSIGPASARLVAEAIIAGDDTAIPPELSARRLTD